MRFEKSSLRLRPSHLIDLKVSGTISWIIVCGMPCHSVVIGGRCKQNLICSTNTLNSTLQGICHTNCHVYLYTLSYNTSAVRAPP
jgi:hypothetical protein